MKYMLRDDLFKPYILAVTGFMYNVQPLLLHNTTYDIGFTRVFGGTEPTPLYEIYLLAGSLTVRADTSHGALSLIRKPIRNLTHPRMVLLARSMNQFATQMLPITSLAMRDASACPDNIANNLGITLNASMTSMMTNLSATRTRKAMKTPKSLASYTDKLTGYHYPPLSKYVNLLSEHSTDFRSGSTVTADMSYPALLAQAGVLPIG